MKAEKKSVDVEFLHLHEYSLIAVQGPETAAVLQPLCDIPLNKLLFMMSSLATVGKNSSNLLPSKWIRVIGHLAATMHFS